MDINDLSSKSVKIEYFLQESTKWLEKYKGTHPLFSQFIKDIKYDLYKIKQCKKAISTRMGLAVYGASQAGKSYFVSNLIRHNSRNFNVNFGDYSVDFLKVINPPGGKESTGLVTRFTVEKFSSPPGYPVKVKLLSEIDLVKLLVNSVVNDFSDDESADINLELAEIEATLEKFDNNFNNIASPVSREEIYSLQRYCSNFRQYQNTRLQAMRQSRFWDRAIELIPFIGFKDRAALYNLLWGNIEMYNSLFISLGSVLEKFKHPEFAFCPQEVLFKNENNTFSRSNNSIIDVTTLDLLDSDISKKCNIFIEKSGLFEVNVTDICALTSEITLHVDFETSDIFDKMDLLDFPGARSRKQNPRTPKVLNASDTKINNFLRGKIAYLFDSYSENFNINSLVICVGPSNLEVVGISDLIEDWVGNTYGFKSSDRINKPNALFLVLTKFDQEFNFDSGKNIDESYWVPRITASIIKPFALHCPKTNWVNEWTPNNSFNNVFWFRNPQTDQSGLIKYEGKPGESLECGILSAKDEIISKLKSFFLQDLDVNKYFNDPLLAWEAGLSLNDGGASYLVENLRLTCNPNLKVEQIATIQNEIVYKWKTELSKHYIVIGDEALSYRKMELAKSTLTQFASLLQRNVLGEFLSLLQLDTGELIAYYRKCRHEFERSRQSFATTQDRNQKDDVIDKDIFDELGIVAVQIDKASESEKKSNNLSNNFSENFIHEFIYDWKEKVKFKVAGSITKNYFNLNINFINDFLDEIEIAIRRTDIKSELIRILSELESNVMADKRAQQWYQLSIFSATFNEFIFYGCKPKNFMNPYKVVSFDGKEKIVFNVNNSSDNIVVKEETFDFSKMYLYDWLHAIQYSIRNNFDIEYDINFDPDRNEALKKLFDVATNLN
jgi:hypothetical protein